MLKRRECENATHVELTKLTHDPNSSDADRIFGSLKLLQAQSVADSCYDAKTSDKSSDIAKLSGGSKAFALRESFMTRPFHPAPYRTNQGVTYQTTTFLSVMLLGAAVACFWRAAA